MRDFYIGDRVVLTKDDPDHNGRIIIGMTGTVRDIHRGTNRLGVDWDVYVCGHDLNGKCESGHGWWVPKSCVGVVKELDADAPFDPVTEEDLLRFFFGQ